MLALMCGLDFCGSLVWSSFGVNSVVIGTCMYGFSLFSLV